MDRVVKSIGSTARRFPIAFAGVLGLAGWSLWTVVFGSVPSFSDAAFLSTLMLVVLCLVSWDVSTRMVSEERNLSGHVQWALKLGGAAATLVAIWFGPTNGEGLFLGLGLVLLVVAAGGSRSLADDQRLWDANAALVLRVGVILVMAVLLFLGLVLLLQGARALITASGDHGMSYTLERAFFLSFFVFAPVAMLMAGSGPERPQFSKLEVRLLTFLTAVVAVPLCIAYLLLVYGQAGLFLLRGEIPANATGRFVSIFGTLGIVTWMLAAGCREAGRWLHVRLYVRHFFPALVISTVVLAYALHLRLAAFGWTPGRVALASIILWFALSIAGWFVRHLTSLGMRSIPIILAMICAVSSFSPLSLTAIAERSQTARLEAALQGAGLLQAGRLPDQMKPVAADAVNLIAPPLYLLSDVRGKRHVLPWTNGKGEKVTVAQLADAGDIPRPGEKLDNYYVHYRDYRNGLALPPNAIWVGSVLFQDYEGGTPMTDISPGISRFGRVMLSFQNVDRSTRLHISVDSEHKSQSIPIERLMGLTVEQIVSKDVHGDRDHIPQMTSWESGNIWIYPQRLSLAHDGTGMFRVQSAALAVVLTLPSE